MKDFFYLITSAMIESPRGFLKNDLKNFRSSGDLYLRNVSLIDPNERGYALPILGFQQMNDGSYTMYLSYFTDDQYERMQTVLLKPQDMIKCEAHNSKYYKISGELFNRDSNRIHVPPFFIRRYWTSILCETPFFRTTRDDEEILAVDYGLIY